MSPDNKKKLNLIRIKLDKLDNKLLSLIKYRTSLVKEVLKLKEFKKEIVDQKRINFILNKIKKKSKKLDKLDNKLLALIKYRTTLVEEVLKLKEFKKEIVDQKRINFILNKIKGKSKKLKIDPKITNRIWKNMIWSYIDYERRNFKKK